jgi:hypothetical protein
MLGKVIRVAVLPNIFKIDCFTSFDMSVITFGLTQKQWTEFEWISIKPRPDKDIDDEYLFRISLEKNPVILTSSNSITFPNGWKFEKLDNQNPVILEGWTIHPITKIKVFKTDDFNGAIIFEHNDKVGKLISKWGITSSFDSPKPLTISFFEEFTSSIESNEHEGLLEIMQ